MLMRFAQARHALGEMRPSQSGRIHADASISVGNELLKRCALVLVHPHQVVVAVAAVVQAQHFVTVRQSVAALR
jgi:hypothetical protein